MLFLGLAHSCIALALHFTRAGGCFARAGGCFVRAGGCFARAGAYQTLRRALAQPPYILIHLVHSIEW